ncbi:MAG: response regulator [Magnetococcales bacterium]|nr:response regulator [Magnetococcales bacterium]
MAEAKNSADDDVTVVFTDSLSAAVEGAVRVVPRGEGQPDRITTLIVHDLQSPLVAMAGVLDLLQQGADTLRPDQLALVERARSIHRSLSRSGQRLFHLYGARHAGVTPRPRFVDGGDVIGAALADVEAQAKWRQVIIAVESPERPRLYVDPLLLQEVLVELLLNAINASQAGDRVVLAATTTAATATLTVRDQGVGIGEAERADLFAEKASTHGKSSLGGRRKRGTSLGLPLAARIVQAQGGTLEVESTPGKGSLFQVRLPNPKPRIVIVDDQPLDGDYLAMLLEPLDMEVIKAKSGSAALVALGEGARDPWGGGGIDLVITDIAMPVMNGFELLEQIVGDPLTAAIPVVLLTGEESMAQRVRGFRMGAADFLLKPVRAPEFLASVDRLLGCAPPGF